MKVVAGIYDPDQSFPPPATDTALDLSLAMVHVVWRANCKLMKVELLPESTRAIAVFLLC